MLLALLLILLLIMLLLLPLLPLTPLLLLLLVLLGRCRRVGWGDSRSWAGLSPGRPMDGTSIHEKGMKERGTGYVWVGRDTKRGEQIHPRPNTGQGIWERAQTEGGQGGTGRRGRTGAGCQTDGTSTPFLQTSHPPGSERRVESNPRYLYISRWAQGCVCVS